MTNLHVSETGISPRNEHSAGAPCVAVTGASGLVGQAFVAAIESQGGSVLRLVRPGQSPAADTVCWNPATGAGDLDRLNDIPAVVHLAGESIASGRWTTEKKRRIRDSRTEGTRRLCESLARLEQPPRVLVSASAIGHYGDRGAEVLTEESAAGAGFLPEVCVAWEDATQAAQDRGIRVVCLRFGVVLSGKGGALAKMLAPFRLGVGGPIGSGRQYWSWISLPDAVGAIQHAIGCEALHGPVNAVAPEPVTNREFSRALGETLHRPALMPLPAFAARLVLGEMADALLLASARVVPARLQSSGFSFRHPDLRSALRDLT